MSDESVSFFDDDNVAATAPPLDEEQLVNVAPESVWSSVIEVNSNTAPFPLSLLIDENVFVSLSVRDPPVIEIRGLLFVE